MNINLKDLTKEQIADLRNQLAELDKPLHYTDIKSWEDAFDKVQPEWYISTHAEIFKAKILHHSKISQSQVPSEAHAKSILASCKLMVIAEALNKGWKPDWTDINQAKYGIELSSKKLDIYEIYYSNFIPILFKSREIAEYCAEQFKDLWYDYFMVEQNGK